MTFPIGRPRFVTLEEAAAWHEIGIAQYGGALGVRDQGLLESALAQAKQAFAGTYAHEYPFEMAAAYAFHVAKNHPFMDGNKRAALTCCSAFLRMNGWDLVSEGEEAADAIIALVENRLTKSDFANWLRNKTRQLPCFELRDFCCGLNAEEMGKTLDSLLAAKSDQERFATVREAVQAMPVLFELEQEAKANEGHAQVVSAIQGMMALLLHMYRSAEDQGYEW